MSIPGETSSGSTIRVKSWRRNESLGTNQTFEVLGFVLEASLILRFQLRPFNPIEYFKASVFSEDEILLVLFPHFLVLV